MPGIRTALNNTMGTMTIYMKKGIPLRFRALSVDAQGAQVLASQ